MIKESVFLIEVANHDIEFQTEIPEKMPVSFDSSLDFASGCQCHQECDEAIGGREDRQEIDGKVIVKAEDDGVNYCVRIIDNGIGFPAKQSSQVA